MPVHNTWYCQPMRLHVQALKICLHTTEVFKPAPSLWVSVEPPCAPYTKLCVFNVSSRKLTVQQGGPAVICCHCRAKVQLVQCILRGQTASIQQRLASRLLCLQEEEDIHTCVAFWMRQQCTCAHDIMCFSVHCWE